MSKALTDADLDALDKGRETHLGTGDPGPDWRVENREDSPGHLLTFVGMCDHVIRWNEKRMALVAAPDTAAEICAARNALPALIREVRAARKLADEADLVNGADPQFQAALKAYREARDPAAALAAKQAKEKVLEEIYSRTPAEMAMQGVIDGISRRMQESRSKTQMTLGRLIEELRALAQPRMITGFGKPISFRGYYSDLAFEPDVLEETVGGLLHRVESCMGKVFEGYKGGDFLMGENTPVWIAPYGDCGPRLMGLDVSLPTVRPILEEEA